MTNVARDFMAALLAAWSVVAHATPPEVTVQHLSTVVGDRGTCSVRFAVETATGEGDAGTVKLDLRFVDGQKREVARGEIVVELSDMPTGRYKEAYIDGEGMCFDTPVSVVVRRARSEHRGQRFDLLKLRKVRASDFRPFTLILGRPG